MNSACLSNFRRLVPTHSRISWFSLLVISATQLCWGDVPSSTSGAPRPENKQISSTIASLNRANLGDCAEMEIPDGYRLIDANNARIMLDRADNTVSAGLLGVIAPESGKWWAVVEFNDIGYVKNVDEQVDFGAILKAVQSKNDAENAQLVEQSRARIASVNWEIEPRYDAAAHSLEWAFRVQGQAGKVINHTIALLTRRGVLSITAVQSIPPSQASVDPIPLNELTKKITFKQGQSYADYQDGDKVASAGIKEVIMGDDTSAAHQDDMAASHPVPAMVWFYSCVGGSIALATALLVYGKFKKRKARPSAYTNGHALPAHQGNGKNGSALNRNGGSRQRKVFNYQKFYSDMVLELSGHTYAWVNPGNGHARSGAAESAAPQPTTMVPGQMAANVNAELIACQKSLIEEQKNLMREQTRIIEEKAKLIAEYNQLMEKWSDDQFSLKLD